MTQLHDILTLYVVQSVSHGGSQERELPHLRAPPPRALEGVGRLLLLIVRVRAATTLIDRGFEPESREGSSRGRRHVDAQRHERYARDAQPCLLCDAHTPAESTLSRRTNEDLGRGGVGGGHLLPMRYPLLRTRTLAVEPERHHVRAPHPLLHGTCGEVRLEFGGALILGEACLLVRESARPEGIGLALVELYRRV